MEQRLTKAERIRRRADYLRVQGSGRKFPAAGFVCFGALSADRTSVKQAVDIPAARLGITVSRRVGGAVVRNRVKRLIREAFRRHKQVFPRGLELVVIARSEAAQVTYAQVERELLQVGRRISGGDNRSRPQ